MKAIILAGGFSTRLYPITKNFPKGLLNMGNKTILDYTLTKIVAEKAVEEIAIVTNSLYQSHFTSWLKKSYPGKKILLIDNQVKTLEERKGAIADLVFTLEKTGWQDDLLVCASDTLTSLSIKKFIDYFRKKKETVNAVFKAKNKAEIACKLGCALLKADRLISFTEKPDKPKSLFMSIPFYIFPKKSLTLIKEYFQLGQNLDSPGSILTWLLQKTPVYCYKVKGYYWDVGTFETYTRLKNSRIFTAPK